MRDVVWDIIEDEADYKFYIRHKDKPISPKPAFIVLSKEHLFNPWRGRYALFLNGLALVGTYGKFSDVKNFLRERVEKARHPLELYIQTRRRRKLKLFAKNFGEGDVDE